MKFIWEASDIQAGRRVGKFNRTEQWMIGYNPALINPLSKWSLISLEDGMVTRCDKTREQIAAHLNAIGDYPVELFNAMKRSAEESNDG